MFKLSIVIPVFNNCNFTKSCLEDLMKLTHDHQIIVVDNGSTDDTEKVCMSFIHTNKSKPDFVYFKWFDNIGFAEACNIGFKRSEGANVLFLNNDIRVKSNYENWTKELIEHAEDGCLASPNGGLLDSNLNFISETSKYIDSKYFYLSGWCLAGSKETFRKLEVDGKKNTIFSPEFGKAYFEDTDLGFRAKDMNIPLAVVDVPVHHFGRMTTKKVGLSSLYLPAKEIFQKKWAGR